MANEHEVNYSVAKKYAVWRSDENTLDSDGNDPMDGIEENAPAEEREKPVNNTGEEAPASSRDSQKVEHDEQHSVNSTEGETSVKEDVSKEESGAKKDAASENASEREADNKTEDRAEVINHYTHEYNAAPPDQKKSSFGWLFLIILICMIISSVVSVGLYVLIGRYRETKPEVSPVNVISSPVVEKTVVEEVIENVSPCVVTIVKEKADDESEYVGSAGTGFIVDYDGNDVYIITSYHVAEQFKSITVTYYDGSSTPADLVAYNEKVDLALLTVPISKIPRGTDIKTASLGSGDNLSMGQGVIVIGNSLGIGLSASTGIISALNRQITLTDPHTNNSFTIPCLQTDAAINQGSSGGPLFNMNGEVIGVVESKYKDTGVEGIGYAIPINDVKPYITELIEHLKERNEMP